MVSRRRWWIPLALVGLAFTVAFVGVGFLRRHFPSSPPQNRLARLIAASPFANVAPEVRFVGDAACTECHPLIAETYARHPMGRSFAAISPQDASFVPAFDRQGLRLSAKTSEGQLVHRVERLDGFRQPLAVVEREIRYVLGSGTRGKSYLIEREGCLTQSPLSWFSQSQTWDLSPGFHAFYPPEPIVAPACLFCHVHRAEVVPHTRNRYQVPIFQGLAIGCERCHGPGERHVAQRRQGMAHAGTFDTTIVHPGHLTPQLRDAVCEQCHLQGEKRILRQGRGPFDFRPGLPLHEFWSIFLDPPSAGQDRKAVGHVEQMHLSRCYQESSGRLGCVSCHDPHQSPSLEERDHFFRSRCLKCHETRSCSLPQEARRTRDDRCIDCHMPRFPTSNIAHTAVTDHRVLRHPERREERVSPSKTTSSGALLVNAFARDLDPEDDTAERDRGLALLQVARQPGPHQAECLAAAEPLLSKAVHAVPDDAEAWEGWVQVLMLRGRDSEALQACVMALTKTPRHEGILGLAAQLFAKQGQRVEAIAHLRTLLVVNPGQDRAHLELSRLLAQRGEHQEALQEVQVSLQYNPLDPEARQHLVACYLHLGQVQQAEEAYHQLIRWLPNQRMKLQTWYEAQKSLLRNP